MKQELFAVCFVRQEIEAANKDEDSTIWGKYLWVCKNEQKLISQRQDRINWDNGGDVSRTVSG